MMGGKEKLAEKLDIHWQTVYVWITRRGYPKIGKILRMVELSDGFLTIEDIIEGTRPLTKQELKEAAREE